MGVTREVATNEVPGNCADLSVTGVQAAHAASTSLRINEHTTTRAKGSRPPFALATAGSVWCAARRGDVAKAQTTTMTYSAGPPV
jgi:hypothetical protein